MESREQRILVTQASPGLVLARPVTLPDRMVLVGSGVTLTETMIGQLMSRGIKRVVVRGHPIPGPAATEWGERVRLLDERFERARTIPLMAALRDIVARSMARRL